eukprot:3461858-Heterocapsa_arctica.AAC.1
MGGGLLWACDISLAATRTFNRNFRGAQTASLDDLSNWHRMRGTDVITAGFPCQSFSGAGLKEGLNDPRGKVLFHIIEICRAIRPPFL